MALFSFRHSVKTFSEKRTDETRAARPGETAAHLRYITRPQAARVVVQERLSGGTQPETASHAEQEAQKRKGRVCERFVIALPAEASPEQREALTRAYAEQVSKGIAGYVAAIHDQHGNDTMNPHAHFVFFDVQQKTGGRGRPKSALGFARKNAIENAAQAWAEIHNRMMRGWGFGAKSEISHLSYADRGIDRVPTIHEGASSRATPDTKKTSKAKWKHIDQGHTRAEANTVIREINKMNEEKENAGVRLGTEDGSDPTQRSSRVAEQREHNRGHGPTAQRNVPPFGQGGKSEAKQSDHRRATGPADRPDQTDAAARRNSLPPFLAPPRVVMGRRFRARRGFRRVFRELIMLRDTLKARIQKANGSASLRNQGPEREISALHSQKRKKPRMSGADREV